MNDEQVLKRAVSLGEAAEAFIKSSIGKNLVAKAQSEIDQAVDGLKTVSPTDTLEITRLQNEIWRAESFIVWLAEIVQEGMNAEDELNPENTED